MNSSGRPRTDFDDLDVIFLRVRRDDIAFIKFIFESYEEVGLIRTFDQRIAIVTVLVCPDFRLAARGILDSLRTQIEFEEIDPPAELGDDWLLRFVPGFVECPGG